MVDEYGNPAPIVVAGRQMELSQPEFIRWLKDETGAEYLRNPQDSGDRINPSKKPMTVYVERLQRRALFCADWKALSELSYSDLPQGIQEFACELATRSEIPIGKYFESKFGAIVATFRGIQRTKESGNPEVINKAESIDLNPEQRQGLETVVARLRAVLRLCPDGDVSFDADEFIQQNVLGGCIATPRRKISGVEEKHFRQQLADNGTLFAVFRLFHDLDPDTASGYGEQTHFPGSQVWSCYNYVSELIQPWNRWRAAKHQSEDGRASTSIAAFLTPEEEQRRPIAFQKIRQKADFLESVLNGESNGGNGQRAVAVASEQESGERIAVEWITPKLVADAARRFNQLNASINPSLCSLADIDHFSQLSNQSAIALQALGETSRRILQLLDKDYGKWVQVETVCEILGITDRTEMLRAIDPLIASKAVSFSRCSVEPVAPRDTPKDGHNGVAYARVVPIAGLKINPQGAALLASGRTNTTVATNTGTTAELVEQMMALVESLQQLPFHESDTSWQNIIKLDARIAVAANQVFPNVEFKACERFGFCRIPIQRTIDDEYEYISLMTESGFGTVSSQWRQAMQILKLQVCRLADAANVAANELGGASGQLEILTGKATLLKATDPAAEAFRDGSQWCDVNYARENGITPQQIDRARAEKGLYGVRLTDRRKADAISKPWVYRRAELDELSSAIDAIKSAGNPRKKSRQKKN